MISGSQLKRIVDALKRVHEEFEEYEDGNGSLSSEVWEDVDSALAALDEQDTTHFDPDEYDATLADREHLLTRLAKIDMICESIPYKIDYYHGIFETAADDHARDSVSEPCMTADEMYGVQTVLLCFAQELK